MKNKIKLFVLLYVVFLIFSVTCDSDSGGESYYAKIESFETGNGIEFTTPIVEIRAE